MFISCITSVCLSKRSHWWSCFHRFKDISNFVLDSYILSSAESVLWYILSVFLSLILTSTVLFILLFLPLYLLVVGGIGTEKWHILAVRTPLFSPLMWFYTWRLWFYLLINNFDRLELEIEDEIIQSLMFKLAHWIQLVFPSSGALEFCCRKYMTWAMSMLRFVWCTCKLT